MKKIIIAILLFFIAVFFIIRSTFSDVTINKYADYASVMEENATQQGWIPALLPKSAYDIAETHDLDRNELYGSFYYKEKDEEQLLSALKPLPDSNGTYTWEHFLFKVDREKKQVKFRNKP